ncbi:MAG: ribonuclease P protein component [Oceanicaulis sp.]|nr:ribonuclease P protein component [Oceanicaulis sp.]
MTRLPAYPDRAARVTERRDFLRARDGVRAARPGVVVQAFARPGDPQGPARAGFTATRKIGSAVVRNRARRRLREAVRLLLPLHGAPGTDYVFIARAATPARAWTSLLDDVESALISLAPRVRAVRSSDPA